MSLLEPRLIYAPFLYQQAYDFWEKQQQAHWLHCVSGSQRVVTSEGLRLVKDLYEEGKELTLFNNEEIVTSSKMYKTGHRQLFEIKTKEGYSHTVTEDHRVMTSKGWVEAKDLVKGDLLCIQTNEGLFGNHDDVDLAFLHGHHQGDSTQTNRLENKIPEFVWRGNKETVTAYLKGLFLTDGTTYQNKKHASIKLTQINLEFIKNIQLLLLNFGIKSSIYKSDKSQRMMPDGHGSKKLYNCKDKYTLEITHKSSVIKLDSLINIFASRGKSLRGFDNPKKSHPIVHARFDSLQPLEFDDVYCVSVNNEYKAWVCNGFVTHNTEVSMAGDISDWKSNLSTTEKFVIGSVLKGFTQAEIVIEDYWANKVAKWFKHPEIQMMANTFASFESIHAVSYAYLNQSLGLEDYAAFLYEPSAKAKIDRLVGISGKSKREIALSLAIFSAFNEGVNLFSSFAILLNFSRFNKLRGVGQIIQFSIRDESLHSTAGCWLFRTFINENPELWTDELKKEIYDAARTTVQLEDAFIDMAFANGNIEGLTKEDLKTYIRFRTNTKLQDLGLKSNWKNIDKSIIDKFFWFDVISQGVEHADFFSGRVTTYAKGSLNWDSIYDNA